jgi:hypothetical protein
MFSAPLARHVSLYSFRPIIGNPAAVICTEMVGAERKREKGGGADVKDIGYKSYEHNHTSDIN